MAQVLTDRHCVICGIPVDAECFDVSGVVGSELRRIELDGEPLDFFTDFGVSLPEPLPRRGEQKILASFQLHPQYCGVLTYFAQFTDLYAIDNSRIQTPGFEWLILQNGKPVFPYTRLEMIINPWAYNCLPISIRLDENAKVEFVIRNRSIKDEDLEKSTDGSTGKSPRYPIRVFGGRLVGRYWYNEVFGGRVR